MDMSAQTKTLDSERQVQQIVEALGTLPPEKVTEVRDYVWFLQARYSRSSVVDINDSWSKQDMHDLTAASLAYAAQSLWIDDEDDDANR